MQYRASKHARTIIVYKATRVTAQALYNHRGLYSTARNVKQVSFKPATEGAAVTRSGRLLQRSFWVIFRPVRL